MEYNLFVTQDCCQFKGSQRLLGFQGSRLLLGSIKYKVQNAVKFEVSVLNREEVYLKISADSHLEFMGNIKDTRESSN